MAAVQSALKYAILLLFTVTLTLCQDMPRHWTCEPANACYEGSHGFMNRYDATKFCENHNMTLGISSPRDYETLIKVPYATNYTWIGITRYKLYRWQFLSGVDFPTPIISHGSQRYGYQRGTGFFSDECYEKKKYVCHREQGIDPNFTIRHTPLSWFEARNDCLKRGGDLYDANLYGYVVFNTSSNFEHFWVGITKDVWTWTASGKRVNMTYWSPSQPYGNGTCVSFNANGWYLSNCQDDKAQALCFTRKDTSTTSSPSQISTTSTEPATTTKQSSTPTIAQSSSLSTIGTQKTDVTNKSPVMADDGQGNKSKIIGGVIGGAVSLIVIVIVAIVLIRNRKKQQEPVIAHSPQDHLPEAEVDPYYSEISNVSPPSNQYENVPNATDTQKQPPLSLNAYEPLRPGNHAIDKQLYSHLE